MPFSFHISAKLHDDKKSCKLTYYDPSRHFPPATSTTELPKLVATALAEPLEYTEELGTALYQLLDGDARYLAKARNHARHLGVDLLLRLELDTVLQNLPFELLYDGQFLLLSEMELMRQVGDRGQDRQLTPVNRPLKLLFMACSPKELNPRLEFEQEEEAIYRATDKLPIEITVEDSGSLHGLAEKLTPEKFDIIHLSGHADLDPTGAPFFWMEDEKGERDAVYPAELWRTLRLHLPSVLFLAGCRTGESDPNHATGAFAQQLVGEGIPAVLGWGRPVYDIGSTEAAQKLYFELSRGIDLLAAVLACRRELSESDELAVSSVWPLLRQFTDATPFVPLVTTGQRRKPTELQKAYNYLAGTQIKILTQGFRGRHRELQQGLYVLRHGQDDPTNTKVGVLLHGAPEVGKTILAGRLIERLAKETKLAVVSGHFDTITFEAALHQAFMRSQDEAAKAILAQNKTLPEKLQELCFGPWQENRYLILLDGFDQNFVQEKKAGETVPVLRDGWPVLEPTAATVVQTLLQYLPHTAGMTSLIITSRQPFRLQANGVDLVSTRLAEIGLS